MFFQSTKLGGNTEQVGLFDLLFTHLHNVENIGVFDELLVIVPDYALADYISDKIALRNGICANLKFEILFGPVLNNIYLQNNPTAIMFDFAQAKYIIYEYLCANKLNTVDAIDLNNYIYPAGKLDKYKAFQLATQLQQIFQEYMYLRTSELINLNKSKFPNWQKQIIQHLFLQISPQKTFLDVYNYFANIHLDDINLPAQLFIFGLNSVYSSQLQIIKKIAQKVNVYWYYKTCSFEYYGDLLTDKAKSKLEKRLLRKPELSLDDLYLHDANPLVANLVQQSREFIELLRANDIDVYSFDAGEYNNTDVANTFLSVLKDDIYQIKYRIEQKYRLNANNLFYADPIVLGNIKSGENDYIYDLPNDQLSINISICHNKMREVQVLFNRIIDILNKNPDTKLDTILICAPDINVYDSYIRAVFDNEFAENTNNIQYKLPYSLVSNVQNYKTLANLKLIINTPYDISVNYLLEILALSEVQQCLDISLNEIELIKKWLYDNHINFGYNEDDYSLYGYENYSVHSLKQLLNNLVLGVCISDNMFELNNTLPIYNENVPYDNLDYTQFNLCNKLINLIETLEKLRDIFYKNIDIYNELIIQDAHIILSDLCNSLLINDDNILICEKFLGFILNISPVIPVTLPILNMIIDDYMNDVSNKVNFNGKICCVSMQSVRNIPFDYVCILGMNFGEFPTTYNPNQLSLLATDWSLADRNYNIEDKQVFLDTILATGKQLYISYIGRKESDNSEIKPSSVVSILLTTLGQSFINFTQNDNQLKQNFEFKNVIYSQSLHPFYNNKQINFSTIWHNLSVQNADNPPKLRWNFSENIQLTNGQKDKYYQPKIKNLCHMFLYRNVNLYRTLNINLFDDEQKLEDHEDLTFTNKALTKEIFAYFSKYLENSDEIELRKYLTQAGILSYAHIGEMQFAYYKALYQKYISARGKSSVLEFYYNLSDLSFQAEIYNNILKPNLYINDEVWLDDNKIIIIDNFANIKNEKPKIKLSEISYELRVIALIICSLVKNGALINGLQAVDIPVVIRQINLSDEPVDLLIELKDTSVIDKLLATYVYSLTNPMLVHKKAIAAYVDAKDEQRIDKMQEAYFTTHSNYDLERIRQDIIYSSVADDYFELVAMSHELDRDNVANNDNIVQIKQNDLIILGDLLFNLVNP